LKSSPVPETKRLTDLLASYRTPSHRRSLTELILTAALFCLSWAAAFWALQFGYWATLLLSVPAAGFLLRLFMIQHDCGHSAFFRPQRANDLVGTIIGVLTLMPYAYWRRTHAIHHKTSGNLDNRQLGDIDTLTVREYRSRTPLARLGYRLYRHPLILLTLGPFYQFVLKHRLPLDIPWSWKREWRSVLVTNVGIAAILLVAWRTVGLGDFLAVQVPVTLITGSIGVFLFYVQHQFEDTYWRRQSEWDFQAAGLQGSSYLSLPRVLHWLTANIGYHHIHHVGSKIPFYRLPRCFEENPEIGPVTHLTLWDTVKCLRLKLWDEEARKLVGFHAARAGQEDAAEAA